MAESVQDNFRQSDFWKHSRLSLFPFSFRSRHELLIFFICKIGESVSPQAMQAVSGRGRSGGFAKKNNLRPRMRYSRFLLSIPGDVHGWATGRRAFFLQHAMSRFISLPPFAFANVPHMMMMMIPSSSLAGRRNRVTLGITQGAPSHKGGGGDELQIFFGLPPSMPSRDLLLLLLLPPFFSSGDGNRPTPAMIQPLFSSSSSIHLAAVQLILLSTWLRHPRNAQDKKNPSSS